MSDNPTLVFHGKVCMAVAHILGYPSIGERRALKSACEAFLRGDLNEVGLREIGKGLREEQWRKQSGLDFVTVGDFTFHDRVLDHALMFGAIPARFLLKEPLTEQDYFTLTFGNASQPAMERTSWFGTEHHYIVPELNAQTRFSINAHDFLTQLEEASKLRKTIKPVLLGPVSLLYLSKADGIDKLSLIDNLAEQYAHLLKELYHRKIEWVQIDEPVFGLELDDAWLKAVERAYAWFRTTRPKLLLATYFANVARYQGYITYLPFDGIHIDLVHAPEQLAPWVNALPGHWVLSAGIVAARHAEAGDTRSKLALLQPVARKLGERLWVAPDCSLLHTPLATAEAGGNDWLTWVDKKLEEVRELAAAVHA